jgi:tetratricopeptide (TPR) repeat protein
VHYQYAWLLSRETLSANGRITGYSPEAAAIMREQLAQTIKLSPDFAPAYYLFALVDLVRDERLDEALDMAQKAQRLAPGKASFTLLLAQVHARRSEAAAARELAERLTRDSDAAIREEAQELLDSLNNTSSANRGSSGNSRAPISGALVAEPVQSSTTRMLGGDASGGTAIRDGQKIENSGSLPSVDEILTRYVEAMGGEKAIKAVSSRVVKGTVDVAGLSRGGLFESYSQAPNKFYNLMEAHPFGTTKMGYNGRAGWIQNNGKTIMSSGAELARLMRDADFFAPLGLKTKYAKVTLAGMSQIGYRDVYVLELQPAMGTLERLYLDAKTYLPVRANRMESLGKVSAPSEVYFDDWRAVDGIQFPFSISQSMPKVSMSFTIKEIRHNVPIDARLFEPPLK